MTIVEVLMNTDWEALRNQKNELCYLANDATQDSLGGILEWIDAIQDAAVFSGIASELEVFGELSDA